MTRVDICANLDCGMVWDSLAYDRPGIEVFHCPACNTYTRSREIHCASTWFLARPRQLVDATVHDITEALIR